MINEPSHLQKHLFKSSRKNVQLAQEENENVEWRNTLLDTEYSCKKTGMGKIRVAPKTSIANLLVFNKSHPGGGGNNYCGTMLSF